MENNLMVLIIDKNIHTRDGVINELQNRDICSKDINILLNNVFDEINEIYVLIHIDENGVSTYGIDIFDQIGLPDGLPDELCTELTKICALQLVGCNINILNEIDYYKTIFKIVITFLDQHYNIRNIMSEHANDIMNDVFIFMHNVKMYNQNTIDLSNKIVVSPVHC